MPHYTTQTLDDILAPYDISPLDYTEDNEALPYDIITMLDTIDNTVQEWLRNA